MKILKVNDLTHVYLIEKSMENKKTIAEMLDVIIEIFKQVTVKISFEKPGKGNYNTYKKIFYEQNKHLLEPHAQKFYESSKENMNIFLKANKEKLQLFKIAYAQQQKVHKATRLKQYNQEYYQRNKNV